MREKTKQFDRKTTKADENDKVEEGMPAAGR